ncbi:hypothetical protein PMAYCL1PPCAC_26620, partial [Pristionchus mayeri]
SPLPSSLLPSTTSPSGLLVSRAMKVFHRIRCHLIVLLVMIHCSTAAPPSPPPPKPDFSKCGGEDKSTICMIRGKECVIHPPSKDILEY